MILNIALGCLLMVVTTVVHAACTFVLFRMIKLSHADRWGGATRLTRVTIIASVVLGMFLATLVEAWIWAATYRAVGAFTEIEPALYFSMVTFTTLGYGDIVLDAQWRLLASFEAANGVIMLGWTTAIIVATVHHIYLLNRSADDARS